MRKEFEELYNTYLGYSQEEKIQAAQYGCSKVYQFLSSQGVGNEEIGDFFGALIAFFIGADEKITQAEVDIYNAVFQSEFSIEELSDYIHACSQMKYYFSLNRTIDSMPYEVKQAACIIPLAVVVADGEISEKEADLFEELWYE